MQLIVPPGKGRRPLPVFYNITRKLEEQDLAELWEPLQNNSTPRLKTLRYNHHLLAKAVASGKSGIECSTLTGMTQARISDLKNDPAFQELVSYYAEEMHEVYVDVHQRMAALGTSILEELSERFESDPDKFTKRELMDLFTTMADRSISSAKGGPALQTAITAGPNGGLALQINFVSPSGEAPKTLDLSTSNPIPAPPTQAPAVLPSERHEVLSELPPLPAEPVIALDGEIDGPTPAPYPTRPEIAQAKRDLAFRQIEEREAEAAERERQHEEYLKKKRAQLDG